MTNTVGVPEACRFYMSCKDDWIRLIFDRCVGVFIRVVHAFIKKPDITRCEWLSVYRMVVLVLYEKKLM